VGWHFIYDKDFGVIWVGEKFVRLVAQKGGRRSENKVQLEKLKGRKANSQRDNE